MNIVDWNSEGATLQLSPDELDALRNGLNESRLLLSEADFPTRVGISLEEAGALIKALQLLIGQVDGVVDAAADRPGAEVKRAG